MAVTTVAAAVAATVRLEQLLQRAPVSSGTSPDSRMTVPVLPARRGSACCRAWAVPSCGSCTANVRPGRPARRSLTACAAVADDHGHRGRSHSGRGVEDVLQHRPPGHRMEHLRQL